MNFLNYWSKNIKICYKVVDLSRWLEFLIKMIDNNFLITTPYKSRSLKFHQVPFLTCKKLSPWKVNPPFLSFSILLSLCSPFPVKFGRFSERGNLETTFYPILRGVRPFLGEIWIKSYLVLRQYTKVALFWWETISSGPRVLHFQSFLPPSCSSSTIN